MIIHPTKKVHTRRITYTIRLYVRITITKDCMRCLRKKKVKRKKRRRIAVVDSLWWMDKTK